MDAKLTLRLEEKLIDQAKDEARKRGTSVSKLVAAYFRSLDPRTPKTIPSYPPITSKLVGALRGNLDPEDYRKHLEEKYL
jgi:hypothetical protein